MKRISRFSVALVALLALSAAMVSSASAAFTKVEFIKAGTKNGFTGKLITGLTPTLIGTGITVTCTGETSKGTLGGTKTMTSSGTVVTFTTCKGENSSKVTCEVNSSGSGNTVTTEKLGGELGTAAAAEAPTEVALLLKPENTENVFTTLHGSCLPINPSKVTGSIAGGASPINTSQSTGELTFNATGTTQGIKKVNVGLPLAEVKPSLKAFGLSVSQMTAETLTFEEATEVHAA